MIVFYLPIPKRWLVKFYEAVWESEKNLHIFEMITANIPVRDTYENWEFGVVYHLKW